jgi:tellurite methyltransferase
MLRSMVGFHQDSEAHWVAELSCGHGQHVRHRPPFELRPWVLSPEGRSARLGQSLECVRCDRREMPEGHVPYKRTPRFTESTIPAGLLRHHETKPGVWARVVVERGELEFYEGDEHAPRQVATPSQPCVILPEVEHRVAPVGEVAFYVEFWRAHAP